MCVNLVQLLVCVCVCDRPLCRMVVGMSLVAASFFSAAVLNVVIEVSVCLCGSSRPLVYGFLINLISLTDDNQT